MGEALATYRRSESLLSGPAAAHGPDVAEVPAGVGLQRADLLLVRGGDELEPVQPEPPAVGQGVGHRDVQDAAPLPVPPPPARRVQAVRHFRSPPLGQVPGDRVVNLAQEPGQGDAHRTARLDEPGEVVQVQVVRAVVHEGVDGHDGVEESLGERQRPGVGADREDAVLDAGVPNPLDVLRGAEPQVRRPDLHAELAAEEDRRQSAPASEVQHPHAGPQVERFGEPLGQPQRVGAPADPRQHPLRVVSRGARKTLRD